MDAKTQAELTKIGAHAPKHLTENIMKTVVDTSEEDVAKDLLKRGAVKGEEAKRIAALIDRGAFRRSEQVENEKVIRELGEYHKARVDKAMREGKLADPKEDAFVKRRAGMIKQHR